MMFFRKKKLFYVGNIELLFATVKVSLIGEYITIQFRVGLFEIAHGGQKVLSSAEVSLFYPEIINFCHIKKYRYKSHFNI